MENKKIPASVYKEILKVMPICCVDGLLHYGKKIVLFKRAYEPAKDLWWTFGGRIYKEEHLETAIKRKAREEIGININIEKQIGAYEYMSDICRQGNFPVHSVSVFFLVTSDEKPDFSKAKYKEFIDIKEFDKIDEEWPDLIKAIIRGSGILL